MYSIFSLGPTDGALERGEVHEQLRVARVLHERVLPLLQRRQDRRLLVSLRVPGGVAGVGCGRALLVVRGLPLLNQADD